VRCRVRVISLTLPDARGSATTSVHANFCDLALVLPDAVQRVLAAQVEATFRDCR
jgi:hypothetical protein